MRDRGWMHFEQAPARHDAMTGPRGLSVAVLDDGVTFTVSKDGRPASCTISFDDWDLLEHFVELGRRG